MIFAPFNPELSQMVKGLKSNSKDETYKYKGYSFTLLSVYTLVYFNIKWVFLSCGVLSHTAKIVFDTAWLQPDQGATTCMS